MLRNCAAYEYTAHTRDCPIHYDLDVTLISIVTKEIKIGEGTYANVYRGSLNSSPFLRKVKKALDLKRLFQITGQEISTGRKVAIKRIKAGAFKDGIDISAIREIKFLKELRHPNVIEVKLLSLAPFLP